MHTKEGEWHGRAVAEVASGRKRDAVSDSHTHLSAEKKSLCWQVNEDWREAEFLKRDELISSTGQRHQC